MLDEASEGEVGLVRARAGSAAASTPGPAPVRGAREDASALLTRARELVAATFGFPTLRPNQERAIEAALAGRDLVLVLSTGAGKSLCYQVPALLRPGLTVVVSPLISLMHDQVAGLRENGVAAAMLSSAQSPEEKREIERAIARSELKILYVAPERLMADGFLGWLVDSGLSAVAIDEAHCISHWGHDFRPEYRMLGELRQRAPAIPLQAFTATATPEVRADIAQALALRDPLVLVGGFDRPNLTYRVLPRRDLVAQVHGVIGRHAGEAGIVYALRRTDVEKLTVDLSALGVRCASYHAGLDSEERKRTQNRFQNEELDVVVATVAFGMGIDRSDVRYVVHANLPKGVEQYSQETGRAGRDGLAAECVLFYGGQDYHGWKNLMEMSARTAASEGVETAGADLENALERLGHLWRFATSATCRHRALCEYFGQTYDARAGGCGACDVCLGEIEVAADSQVIAQKILSCVVRCGQRYGAQHVSDILRGAETAKLRQTGHDKLSTYGLLREHSNATVRSWIDQLVGQGHLRTADGEYPTLFLSKDGIEVMRGQLAITLYVPVAPSAKDSKERKRSSAARSAALEEGGPALDDALFEALRELRRNLARERGVPPYLIFGDRTLALMAAHKPATAAEFRAIKGVGDKKALDLGPTFLAAIAQHAAAR